MLEKCPGGQFGGVNGCAVAQIQFGRAPRPRGFLSFLSQLNLSRKAAKTEAAKAAEGSRGAARRNIFFSGPSLRSSSEA